MDSSYCCNCLVSVILETAITNFPCGHVICRSCNNIKKNVCPYCKITLEPWKKCNSNSDNAEHEMLSGKAFFSTEDSLKTMLKNKIKTFNIKLSETVQEMIINLKMEVECEVNKNLQKLEEENRNHFLLTIKHLQEENKRLKAKIADTEGTILRNENNEINYLKFIVERVQKGDKIFAYVELSHVLKRFGEINYRDQRVYLHSLTFSKIEKKDFLVKLIDVRTYISSTDYTLFIIIGRQNMYFRPNKENNSHKRKVLELFTGNMGSYLKGIEMSVEKKYILNEESIKDYDSLDLNLCKISMPSSSQTTFKHFDIQSECDIYEDKIILQCIDSCVFIFKVSKIKFKCLNVIGTLHEDCQINFDDLLNQKVQDSGISFPFKCI